jgi:putative DNA primase/helicase
MMEATMTSAAEVIAALGGNSHTGMCRCPAHDDNNPSLHVDEKNGKLLVHCHAGCSQEAVMSAFREKGITSNTHRTSTTSTRQSSKSEPVNSDQDGPRQSRGEAYLILRAAAKHSGGSPVEYLKRRGINTVPESIISLPQKLARELQRQIPSLKPFPFMVAPLIGPDGSQGAHVTYLTRDGMDNLRSKNTSKSIRRTYGQLKNAYIQ